MDQDTHQYIIPYIEGELTPEEASTFESMLKQDQSLHEAYREMQLIFAAVQHDADRMLKVQLRQWENERTPTIEDKGSTSWFKTYGWLSLLILSVVVGWFLWRGVNDAQPKVDYMAYYTAPSTEIFRADGDQRGGDADLYQEALTLHVREDWASSIELFKQVGASSPYFGRSKLMILDALINQRLLEEALTHATDAMKHDNITARVKNRIGFTRAILLLELGHIPMGKAELQSISQEAGHPFASKSQLILSDLK